MRYENMEPAVFLERPNRFIAWVETAGGREICHVKNTGRCRELLLPGAALYVQRNNNPQRKTPLDLIGVVKGNTLINMDSQAPNKAVQEWLERQCAGRDVRIRPEYRYGNSRVDFYVEAGERKILVEVKGVTLEEEGVARFPDAPTERGVKHIRELAASLQEGYEAVILFVIQMKGIRHMEPNDKTHAAFGEALREAARAGVQVLAYDCLVEPDSMVLDQQIPVKL
ncbi:MAG: DNA/RNA nuclease SfsA [Lachnospiraceae bacterium]|nr:DNA/RNA nuclease SfsA [Lachnospiraceae bacterium]